MGSAISMNAAVNVSRIEPTDWYVGMKDASLQLMVYGKDIKNADVTVNYPGVAFDGRNSAVCGIAELYKGAVSDILSKLSKTFVYRIVYKAHSYRSRIVFAHVYYIRSYHKLQHSGKAEKNKSRTDKLKPEPASEFR